MHRTGMVIWGLAIIGLGGCASGDESTSLTTAFDPSRPTTGDTEATTTDDTGPTTTGVASADGTGMPPGGSCCEVLNSPGCGNPDIQMCVCTIEPACCQEAWDRDCVDLAISCGDSTCEPPPGTGTGPDPGTTDDTGPPPPMLTCDELAAQQGWTYVRCEANGGTQCNGVGTPTTDCDFCCEYCGEADDVSCGDFATMQGWAQANCEWNGNGACGGAGTPTCDCNFCCEVN